MKTLKLIAKGVVFVIAGFPLAIILTVGAALVGVALLAIFLIMDLINKLA